MSRTSQRVRNISPGAMALLTGESWPGNARELENAHPSSGLPSSGLPSSGLRSSGHQSSLSLCVGLLALFACDARDGRFMGADYRDGEWSQARQAVCLTQPPPDPVCTEGEVELPFPAGSELTDFTLLASDWMELRDVTVPGTVAALGLADTVVFSGASIGNIYSRGLVDLRSGATVTGFINTTTQIAVQGSANYQPGLVDINYAFEPVKTESLCFPEPSGIGQATNVFVDVNQTLVSAPGTYNDVELRNDATWVLSPGNYWLDMLHVEPGAVFEVDTSGCSSDCAVVLNLRTELGIPLRGSVEPPNSDLLIVYHGTLPFTLNAAFDGFIVAMNAELIINNNEPHAGAYFARRLTVEAGQTITGRPFPLDAFKAQQP